MQVSLTCDKDQKEKAIDAICEFAKAIPKEGRDIHQHVFSLEVKNEGLTDASTVQYVARAWNYRSKGYEYSGSLNVLRTILSYSYLWGQVRVLGGAYGCMCSFLRSGDAYFVSYRDPNLEKTDQIFEGAADFVSNYDADDRDMLKSIIGAISSIDMPLSPEMKGSRSFNLYLTGYTISDLQRERDEILSTKVSDIRALAPIVACIDDKKVICVVGNEGVINENASMFGSIRPLIK